jgi:chaperonin cofactor prefoldin
VEAKSDVDTKRGTAEGEQIHNSEQNAQQVIDSKQLVREIETQAVAAQQQIGLAKTQITAKQREQRLVRLTLSEMADLPSDTEIYEGVGKM